PGLGWSRRVQVAVSVTMASGLKYTSPSSEPVYTPVPPPMPIAEMKQPRAPLGAAPGHPLVRSPLIALNCTSAALGALALSVRYRRYVAVKSWLVLSWL